MNELAAIQQRFQRHLMSSADEVCDDIRGRMEIYVNAYWGRLREALADNYPVLCRALGDDAFRELAAAYLRAHPSNHRSIRWFGNNLVDFITRNPDVVPHPALLDLARMDWAMRGAFDAADAAPLRFGDLAAVAPEQWADLRFRPVPSFRLLQLDWGIEGLWHTLNENEDAQTDEPQTHAHTMIVWRYGLECRWRTVSDTEASALRTMVDGGCFADICAALLDAGDQDAATSAANLLRAWVDKGLLARE
ncbi:MAG: putative DNA-binding domain-containing protein [Gammaproteobacteria bacterium]|nr:putative DNA-binding domain-containing protein [Gammaproteobacteria bacterium]MBU1414478.1 putative DNA-binding domain-containing protein [Gammaproteobacteria bacterium]